MNKPIKVLVIEATRRWRDGLSALLDAQGDFEVVVVEGANAGVLHVRGAQPAVALVDATLGQPVVESIVQAAPGTKVVVMDLLPARADVIGFLTVGAQGFLVMNATMDDFVRTIRLVATGAFVVPAALTGTPPSAIVGLSVARGTVAVLDSVHMTRREAEISTLMVEGLSDDEVAQQLDLTVGALYSHLHNIIEKLTLHSRLQIVAHAHKARGTHATSLRIV